MKTAFTKSLYLTIHKSFMDRRQNLEGRVLLQSCVWPSLGVLGKCNGHPSHLGWLSLGSASQQKITRALSTLKIQLHTVWWKIRRVQEDCTVRMMTGCQEGPQSSEGNTLTLVHTGFGAGAELSLRYWREKGILWTHSSIVPWRCPLLLGRRCLRD